MLARLALRRAPIAIYVPRNARHDLMAYRAAVRFNSTIPADTSLGHPAPSSSDVKPGPSAERVDVRPKAEEDETDDLDEFADTDALENEVLPVKEAMPPSSPPTEAVEVAAEPLVDFGSLTEAQLSSHPFHGRSIIQPLYHPRTHGIPVATIHLRSHFPYLLNLFSHFSAHAASALGIPISKPTPLPMARNLWTVIKSPFAQKKSQENFERRTYKRVIKAWDADYEVVNRWVKYLETNALAGVGMRVVKWDRAPVGVGQKVLGVVSAAADPQGLLDAGRKGQIEALGQKIVQQELAAIGEPDISIPHMPAGNSKPSRPKATA